MMSPRDELIHSGSVPADAKPTEGAKARLLRVVSRCDTEDHFIEVFRRFCDGETLFIVTRNPKQVGAKQPVSLTLAGGTPVLQGIAEVTQSFPNEDNPIGRAGMRVKFLTTSEESKPVLERLKSAARAVGSAPLPPPAPRDALGEPTAQWSAPPATEQRASGSPIIVPANPFYQLPDESLEAFVECTIYEETGQIDLDDLRAARAETDGGLPAWWPRDRSSTAEGSAPGRAVTVGDADAEPGDDEVTAVSTRAASEPAIVHAPAPPRATVAVAVPPVPALALAPAAWRGSGRTPAPGVSAAPAAPTAISRSGTPPPIPPEDAVEAAPEPESAPAPEPRATEPPPRSPFDSIEPVAPVAASAHVLQPLSAMAADDTGLVVRSGVGLRGAVIMGAIVAVISLGVGYLLWGGGSDTPDTPAAVAPASAPAPAPAPLDEVAPDHEAEPEPEAESEAEAPEAEAKPAEAEPAEGEPAAALAPPQPATGARDCQLVADVQPRGADIYLGVEHLGKTPGPVAIPCGSVELAFDHPRYQRVTHTVTASAGAPARLEARMERPTHTLTVTSSPPGAIVTVAGRRIGKTPATTKVLGYEKAAITVSLPGHKTWSERVYIRRASQTVHAELSGPKKPPKRRARK